MKQVCLLLACLVVLAGCNATGSGMRTRKNKNFIVEEPVWIRSGQPIKYQQALWYPQDGIEVFRAEEMLQVLEFKGEPVYVDRVDIKPYERLYTEFGRHKYRYFEKNP